MEKTISIALNGIIFNIEEEAYQELKKYLDSIKNHYEASESEEILADIESGLAEKFSAKLNSKKVVVTKQEVFDAIKIMGRVEEFESEDSETSEKFGKEEIKNEEKLEKKLYRDPDDVIIAGVSSGLGAYFGIDPVFIRIIFVILFFAQGVGLLIYIILWIAMPKAETNVQKLEMKGKPVNIKKLEETIKEKSKQIKDEFKNNKEGINKLFSIPFDILRKIFKIVGNIFKKFIPLIFIFCGLCLIISVLFGIIGLTTASSIMIFQVDSPFIISDLPLAELAGFSAYYTAVISLFLIILIPLLFVFTLGISLIQRKNSFKLIISIIFLIVWIVSLIVFTVSSLDLAPFIKQKIQERSENQITKEFNFDDFRQIRAEFNGNLKLKKADEYKIVVTSNQNDLNRLRFEIINDELQISKTQDGVCIFCFEKPVQIEISAPHIDSFKANSRLVAEIEDFKMENIKIDSGGSANIKAYLSQGTLSSYIAGVNSRLEIIGSPKNIEAILEGRGSLIAKDLYTQNININQNYFSRVILGGNTEYFTAKVDELTNLDVRNLKALEAKIEVFSGNEMIDSFDALEKYQLLIDPRDIVGKTINDNDLKKLRENELLFVE